MGQNLRTPSSKLLQVIGGTLLLGTLAGTGFFACTLKETKPVAQSSETSPQRSISPLDSEEPNAQTPPSYARVYEQAVANINSPGHQKAFDQLYLAAETAIANDEAPVMLTQLNLDAKSVFNRMASGHPEWNTLVKALMNAEDLSYELIYERAKLQTTQDKNHQREWNLLFEAAQEAILGNKGPELLARLEQDASGRFQRLVNHAEWQQLIEALEKQDRTLLVS